MLRPLKPADNGAARPGLMGRTRSAGGSEVIFVRPPLRLSPKRRLSGQVGPDYSSSSSRLLYKKKNTEKHPQGRFSVYLTCFPRLCQGESLDFVIFSEFQVAEVDAAGGGVVLILLVLIVAAGPAVIPVAPVLPAGLRLLLLVLPVHAQ